MSDSSDIGNEFDALLICYDGTINVHRHIIAKSSKILRYMISRDNKRPVSSLDISEYSIDTVDHYVRHVYACGEEHIKYDRYSDLLHFCICIDYKPIILQCYKLAIDCNDVLYAAYCYAAIKDLPHSWISATCHCYQLVLKNFVTFLNDPGFSQIDVGLLMEILSDSKLKGVNQSSLMYALIRWLRFDINNRDKYADDLFINFDLANLTRFDRKCLLNYKEISRKMDIARKLKATKKGESSVERNTNASGTSSTTTHQVNKDRKNAEDIKYHIKENIFNKNFQIFGDKTSRDAKSSREETEIPHYIPLHRTMQPTKSILKINKKGKDILMSTKKHVYFAPVVKAFNESSELMKLLAAKQEYNEGFPIKCNNETPVIITEPSVMLSPAMSGYVQSPTSSEVSLVSSQEADVLSKAKKSYSCEITRDRGTASRASKSKSLSKIADNEVKENTLKTLYFTEDFDKPINHVKKRTSSRTHFSHDKGDQ